MGKPKRGPSEVGTIAAPIVDRLVALELSANLAHENRLDFARSFSAEIAASCWDAVHGGRVAPGLLAQQYYDGATLSKDARQAWSNGGT